jgi:FtsP/CotA-like multicopper oxidase with cupredoxin domain
MHPFHAHLVNFVAQRRFVFNYDATSKNAVFADLNNAPDGYDKNVRHDTLRVESNQLVELLVYFPEDAAHPTRYTGEFPYHCHLVEHEDMGMMLHFRVVQ